MQDQWENTSYCVLSKVWPNVLVYQIQIEGESTKTHIVHRNMFFPVAAPYGSESDESNTVSCDGASSAVNLIDFDNSYNSSDGEAYTGPVTRS